MTRNLRTLVFAALVLAACAPAARAVHCLPIIVEDVKLIKPDQLRPNATFHVEVPILGQDTHRTRSNPTNVTMSVHLPGNYSPRRAHPVIVHLGGGVDQRKFLARWQGITGNKDFIILLAGYTSAMTTGPRNAGQMLRVLEAATPILHGSVLLAGVGSGSWGMNGNFNDQFFSRGFMDPFDAFIFIGGNNDKEVTVTKDKLRGRPALFIGGNTPAAREIQKKTHESLLAEKADSSYIDMLQASDDFDRSADAKIVEWIRKRVISRRPLYDAFDKKLAAAKTGADYLALLKEPLGYWHGKTLCMTRYIKLAQKETDEDKRTEFLAKLEAGADLPKCNGGDYQEALKWLKTQSGMEALVAELARQNFFLDPVDGHINGYAPGTNFRTR